MYLAFGVVFVVSLVLLALVKGVSPFGVRASWDSTSLVLTHAETNAAAGDRVARMGSREGEVTLYSVLDTSRKDGELYYRTTPVGGSGEETIQARNAHHVVVAVVPVLGLWVRALGHPIGALALLGIPLLTFAFDLILSVSWVTFARTFRILIRRIARRRAARRMARTVAAAQREAEIEEEDVYEEAYEEIAPPTYTGPRTTPQNFGMTIHLSRPRRYSM